MRSRGAKFFILFNGKVSIRMDTADNIRLRKTAHTGPICKYICIWKDKYYIGHSA